MRHYILIASIFITLLESASAGILYSTYIGGSDQESCPTIVVDSIGNAYLTGYTRSSNFPTQTGSYEIIYNLNDDAFITKLNSTGSDLVYSTFLGGQGADDGVCLVLDNNCNAIITGYTSSLNFPITNNVFDNSYNSSTDGFITKLNNTGSSLIYSTYLGGAAVDVLSYITIDNSGDSYVTGHAGSTNFPTTTGAYDTGYNGGSTTGDAVLTKLNSSGSDLVYSTFIGGTWDDCSEYVTLDNSGNSFITGMTYSSDFPATNGVYDNTYNSMRDVFVTKLNNSGSALMYSSFIGGTNDEWGYMLNLDNNDNALALGYTSSTNFPTTTGVYDVSFNGSQDVFLTKLNSGGSALIFSTYLGGSGQDVGGAVLTEVNGYSNIVGFTSSSNFPTTTGAYDVSLGGTADVFYSIINNTGSDLQYSTFLGGSGNDQGFHIAMDNGGNIYLTGETASYDFPTTIGAYDLTYNGGDYDAFVTKVQFIDCDSLNIDTQSIDFGNRTCKGDTSFMVTVSNPMDKSVSIYQTWFYQGVNSKLTITNGGNFILGGHESRDMTINIKPGTYGLLNDTLYIDYPTGCNSLKKIPIKGIKDTLDFIFLCADTLDFGKVCSNVLVEMQTQVENISSTATQLNCSDVSLPFFLGTPNPFATKFTFNETRDLRFSFINKDNGIYYQDFTVTDSCGRNKTIVLKAEVRSPYISAGFDRTICDRDSVQIGNPATGGTLPYNYFWSPQDGLSNPNAVPTNASPKVTTDYILAVVDSFGCVARDTVRIYVNPSPVTFINGPISVCEGQIYSYNIPTSNGISENIQIDGAANIDSTDKQNILITWGAGSTGHIKVVHINDITNCKDSMNLVITIYPIPHPEITGETIVCSNTLVNYYTTKPADINSWIVNGGEVIGYTGENSINVLWSDVTNASIKLIQLNVSGCTDSIEKDITVKTSPIVDLPDKTEMCQDSSIIFEPVVNSGVPPWTETKWTPSTGLSNPNILNPELSITIPGTYKYYLSVTGSNGCVGIDSINVIVHSRPQFELSKSSIDFGTLEACKSSKEDSLEITNTGTEDINISEINDNSGFTIANPALPFKLHPGEKQQVIVRYTVAGIGLITADLKIVGSPCDITKSVKCTINNNDMLVSTNILSVNYGQSISCDSIAKDTTITLTNTGTSNVTFYFDQTVLNDPFSLVSPTTAITVIPSDFVKVRVHYAPGLAGNYSQDFALPFHAGLCNDTLRIPLSGIVVQSVMSSNLQNIDFQDIQGCDVSRDTVITIQNTGTNNITIIGLEPDSLFTTNQINSMIPTGQMRDLHITFSTTFIGIHTGRLIIKYDPCGILDTFLITGIKQGIEFAVPDSLDFSSIVLCREKSKTIQFTLGNNSSSGIDGYIQNILQISSPFKTTLTAGDSIKNGQVYTYDATFEPDASMPGGDYYGTLDFMLLPCEIKKTIKFHAVITSISLTNTASVDYGKVNIGGTKDETIHIVNTGIVDENIESITDILQPFELISTNPSIPATLKPGDELLVIIRYTPSDTTGDTLVIKQTSTIPCNYELSTKLTGIGISDQNILRKASVCIDPTEASTGQTVTMPLMLKNSENLVVNGQSIGFSVKLRFNSTILAPVEKPDKDVITGTDRIIEISGSISEQSGIMKTMNYTTALGNAKCTDIIIDTVIWNDPKVETVKENGRFCLTNVCPEGGDRLVNPNGTTQILYVHPNPTSGDITIDFKLSESGFTEFLMMNYLGETVKKVSFGEVIDFNAQSMTLNLDDLSTGEYFLVLRTPEETVRQIIMIVR